jgi:hypothetical protein
VRRFERFGVRFASRACLAVLAGFGMAAPVLAGPFVTAGGSAATPTSYVVTVKTIEFRRSDGSYYTFFSGSQTVDIGSSAVAAGGVGGQVGSGQSLAAGTYDGIRVTMSRDFSITATSGASTVGPGAAAYCGTGGSTSATTSGYTVQVVTRSGSQVTPVSRTLSIPPQANTSINAVSGMAVVGAASDIQVTHSLSSFTVLETDTVPPAFTVQFDVSNAVEFLNDGASCYAIFLPPTVTYITPTGTTTYTGPL